jgi:hypothetical protein
MLPGAATGAHHPAGHQLEPDLTRSRRRQPHSLPAGALTHRWGVAVVRGGIDSTAEQPRAGLVLGSCAHKLHTHRTVLPVWGHLPRGSEHERWCNRPRFIVLGHHAEICDSLDRVDDSPGGCAAPEIHLPQPPVFVIVIAPAVVVNSGPFPRLPLSKDYRQCDVIISVQFCVTPVNRGRGVAP